MVYRMTSRGLRLVLPTWVVSIACMGLATAALAQQATEKAPATLAEAKAALNLETLPLMPGADANAERRLASVNYAVKAKTREAFAFHRKQLLDLNWKESPNSYVADESANSVFTRDGFTVSLSVYVSDGKAHVMLIDNGNVDISKLPRPEGSKPVYESNASSLYVTEGTVAEGRAAVDAALVKLGWEPYGEAGDSRYFKCNAVLLHARVLSAPGQGGKTVVDYSTELMSADLPALAGTTQLQYHDSTKALSFDLKSTPDDVYAAYRKILEPRGWKPTTENPVKDRYTSFMIFRNAAKEMLTINIRDYKGTARTELKFATVEDVAAEQKRFEAYAADQKKQREARAMAKADAETKAPKLTFTLPEGASEVNAAKSSLDYKLAAGKAKAAVEAIRTTLGKDGWKEEVVSIQDIAGTVSLKKNDASVTVVFIDSGFFPAEIKIQTFGIEIVKPETK